MVEIAAQSSSAILSVAGRFPVTELSVVRRAEAIHRALRCRLPADPSRSARGRRGAAATPHRHDTLPAGLGVLYSTEKAAGTTLKVEKNFDEGLSKTQGASCSKRACRQLHVLGGLTIYYCVSAS